MNSSRWSRCDILLLRTLNGCRDVELKGARHTAILLSSTL